MLLLIANYRIRLGEGARGRESERHRERGGRESEREREREREREKDGNELRLVMEGPESNTGWYSPRRWQPVASALSFSVGDLAH